MLPSKIKSKPPELSIDRDPSWKNTRREVGDGMEAHPPQAVHIIPAQTTPQRSSVQYAPSSSGSKACSRSSSPLEPPSYMYMYDGEQQSDSHTSKSSLPSHTLNTSLKVSPLQLNDTERCLLEEKSALKDHLQIQIQVNQELKRLLVASVGEDLGFHYERISTEKAQLALEVDELKKNIEAKKEEMERLEISCDIWRSKFLASRMQCDDLSCCRRLQERQVRELESAMRGLLREHWSRSEQLDGLFKTLYRMNTNLNKEATSQLSLDKDNFTLAEKCRKLVNSLSNKLLGSSLLPNKLDEVDNVPSPTPAEKYVLQLLKEMQQYSSTSLSPEANARTSSPRHTRREAHLDRTISRLHFHSACSDTTLNCCPHCKGDIHVV